MLAYIPYMDPMGYGYPMVSPFPDAPKKKSGSKKGEPRVVEGTEQKNHWFVLGA